MKLVLLAISLLWSLALTTPILDKRYVVTSVVYETATVTVTATADWFNWGRPSQTPIATNTVSVINSTPSESTASSSTSTSTTSSTSSASPSSTSVTSSSQPTTSLSAYAEPILRQHNLHRGNHSASDLVWDDRLASIAQEIASSCTYAHNVQAGGGGYGQNIGAGAPDDEIEKMITNQMYNYEIEYYPGYDGEPDMTNFEKWGHFSQIVWKATTSVGCYTQHCTGGLAGVGSHVSPYFTVCNYAPQGEYLYHF